MNEKSARSGSNFQDNISSASSEIQPNKLAKYLGIFISSAFILSILVETLIYLIYSKNSFLFFDYSAGVLHPLQAHIVSIIIFLGILVFMTGCNIYSLYFNNDEVYTQIYYIDTSQFYIFTLLFLTSSVILSLVLPVTNITKSIDLILFILAGLCSVIMYLRTRNKKNLSVTSVISQYFFSSSLLAFYTYSVLYILLNYFKANSEEELVNILAVFASVLFACISLALIAKKKDIVYACFVLLIHIGLIANSAILSETEIIGFLVVLGFMAISIVITVLKYRKGVIGQDDESEKWINDLEKAYENQNI